jgi:hypothetical protein
MAQSQSPGLKGNELLAECGDWKISCNSTKGKVREHIHDGTCWSFSKLED